MRKTLSFYAPYPWRLRKRIKKGTEGLKVVSTENFNTRNEFGARVVVEIPSKKNK